MRRLRGCFWAALGRLGFCFSCGLKAGAADTTVPLYLLWLSLMMMVAATLLAIVFRPHVVLRTVFYCEVVWLQAYIGHGFDGSSLRLRVENPCAKLFSGLRNVSRASGTAACMGFFHRSLSAHEDRDSAARLHRTSCHNDAYYCCCCS